MIIAVPAMAAGAMELRSIEARSEAMRVATQHMMVMGTVWLCFLTAFLLVQSEDGSITPPATALAATASAGLGFLLMSVGGWLGGRLVYELGIGVRPRETPKSQ